MCISGFCVILKCQINHLVHHRACRMQLASCAVSKQDCKSVCWCLTLFGSLCFAKILVQQTLPKWTCLWVCPIIIQRELQTNYNFDPWEISSFDHQAAQAAWFHKLTFVGLPDLMFRPLLSGRAGAVLHAEQLTLASQTYPLLPFTP